MRTQQEKGKKGPPLNKSKGGRLELVTYPCFAIAQDPRQKLRLESLYRFLLSLICTLLVLTQLQAPKFTFKILLAQASTDYSDLLSSSLFSFFSGL